ncbi:MAG: lamin tail domain-containing protein [Candidatus Delongbacteria bacterium]|nr:lamin tail domain-containing protein [Candidatus Cloacimonadota bacterium]MCB9473813.1 lamin tail domain-containing protein [Candidatus Delongbacteria bacterium]
MRLRSGQGALWMLLAPMLVQAQVRLGEVFYDPQGSDSGAEWVEIHNMGSETVNLQGWLLDAGGPNLVLPAIEVPAGAVLAVHTNAPAAQLPDGLELWFQNGTNMGNTHGFVGLWAAEEQTTENLVDWMQYGSTGHSWESQAVEAGIWPAESFTMDVEEGHSLRRISAGNGPQDWIDEADPVAGETSTAVGELMAPGLRLEGGLPVLQWSFDGSGTQFEIRTRDQSGSERLLAELAIGEGQGRYAFTDHDWHGQSREYWIDVRRIDGRLDRLGGPYRIAGDSGSLPQSTRLLAAWPNPFNPGTLLNFELARAGSVSMDLHDLAGRRVRHLELGELSAGSHTLPLELDGQAGGLYFAVLRGPGGGASVLKLILAR